MYFFYFFFLLRIGLHLVIFFWKSLCVQALCCWLSSHLYLEQESNAKTRTVEMSHAGTCLSWQLCISALWKQHRCSRQCRHYVIQYALHADAVFFHLQSRDPCCSSQES